MPVASDYRWEDSSLFSMRSLEDRRQRPTLLFHINRRKVEAFIHSVIIFHWPLCLPQLGTSDLLQNSEIGCAKVACETCDP